MTNLSANNNQLAQDRLGLRIASRLSDASDDLPYDISERLRAARVQAIGKRKIAVTRLASNSISSNGKGTLVLGSPHQGNWLGRILVILPLLALAVGLIAISSIQDEERTSELAEIDAALLTDDLPPAAFTDPGFAQYLKINAGQGQ